jgi:hypothetical protein
MYSWMNAQGQTIKTKTIGEFVQISNFRPSTGLRTLPVAQWVGLWTSPCGS